MTDPIDQPQRERFITELERNFSVVASAGSGKTRAITDRIIALATSPRALELLPALVVVTFTNRAADEMQQRARQRILDEGVSLEVLAAFNRAFFGTIHSFCVKLLRQHGHHLGLPGALDLLTNDDALWMEFVQQRTTVGAALDPAQRRCLLRLAPVRELMELGRHGDAGGGEEPGAFPVLDFTEVYAAVGKGNTKRGVAAAQERLRAWESAWREGDGFAPLPECGTTAKDFTPLWGAALGPVRAWMRRGALRIAAEIGGAYRDFRLAKGAVGYDDQIALASALLRQPEAARRIREKNYRVILDEAQDTDPAQFDTLLEITLPPDANGAWSDAESAPPRAGHFCMVGDFQQSIFGERADLAHYRRVHRMLMDTSAGEEVEFSVTFRLDEKGVAFVNAAFPQILHGSGGQVDFVQLNPRPAVLPGQVVRFELGELPILDGWKDWKRAQLEAERLAAWLREQGLERLRAQSWREVAVLCPRKGWFPPLRDALRAEGFEVQIQSERDLKGDSPAYAWFAALAVVMAEPRHGYEIVGVLREIFGLSDHDLAVFSEGDGGRFQIAEPTVGTSTVADALNLLATTRAAVLALPLFTALREIAEAVRLRERLECLPDGELENPGAELDDLLTLAATAEAEGRTLAEFAEKLRADFSAVREVRTAERDAIQLITCHKAKGSEWEAVIVPFFARGVSQRSRGYPRLLRHPLDGTTHAALDTEDLGEELRAALDAQSRQELERLLYVALTRAKHTLVLADDLALFAGKSGLPKNSAARLLRCDGENTNATVFAALAEAPLACAPTASQQHERTEGRERERTVTPLAPLPPNAADTARENATHFIKRNPSALAEAARADDDPAAFLSTKKPASNDGTRYGTWWHEFIEQLDWRAEAAAWDATFEQALAASPDAPLSRREWALLRAQLTGGSDFARLLTAPGVVAHAELPFLWAMNDRECLEGIIDLAVFDPASRSWLVVDWKTNRTSEGDLPKLRAHYLPQLSAYWQAVGAMLGAPVSAGLYSTVTGRWLPYQTAALAAEWGRLSAVPDALAEALSGR